RSAGAKNLNTYTRSLLKSWVNSLLGKKQSCSKAFSASSTAIAQGQFMSISESTILNSICTGVRIGGISGISRVKTCLMSEGFQLNGCSKCPGRNIGFLTAACLYGYLSQNTRHTCRHGTGHHCKDW